MQRNCTHATVPSAPSTSPGTNPAITVPCAVQHVRGYETQGKRSPPRAGERNHTQKRKPRPLRRVKRHKRIKPYPCNETTKTSPQHVPGHETVPNCSPCHATARGRPRNAGETFPGACWMKMKPHPCNETAPMQRTHLNRAPARPRARDRPQPFPAPCRSTWAATKRKKNVPGRVLNEDETAPMQ